MPEPTAGKPSGSSWGRWVARTVGGDDEAAPERRPAPQPPEPPVTGPDDDLDVTLRWPSTGDEPARAPEADPADAVRDGRSTRDDDRRLEPGPPLGAGDAELLPAVPLLPAIAGRVDALDGHLRALAMRLDVLASSSAALRTAIGERIDGYAASAAASARGAAEVAEEHRRTTERALGELRQGIDEQGDLLRRVAGRVEELGSDVGALLGQDRPAPEPPSSAPSVDLSGLEARLDELREQVDAVASRPQPAPAPAGPSVELAAVLGRVTALEASVARVLDLVALVVDTMPGSAEGTCAELADRVAEAVVARLEDR